MEFPNSTFTGSGRYAYPEVVSIHDLKRVPRGTMPLKVGRLVDTVIKGGPIDAAPGMAFGDSENNVAVVDLTGLIRADLTLRVPDFGVPTEKEFRTAILRAYALLIAGKELYVGCGAGIGRTGMFLAGLVRVAMEFRRLGRRGGIEDPIEYVRKHYYRGAVETPAQSALVHGFHAVPIARWLKDTQLAMAARYETAPRLSVPEPPRGWQRWVARRLLGIEYT